MQFSHVPSPTTMASAVAIDEPNLIAHAGPGTAYPAQKIAVLLAGMLAGADSIDNMGLLRHGAISKLLLELQAASTLGTFLRSFTLHFVAPGHVRQLDAVNS